LYLTFSSQLKRDFDAYAFIGFLVSVQYLPHVLGAKVKAEVKEKEGEEAAAKVDLLRLPQVKRRLRGNLEEVVRKGVLKVE